MTKTAFMLNDYSLDKSWPGRLIQVIAEKREKWQADALWLGGFSDYAVTKISQYVWRRPDASLRAKSS
ncbi:hypothetical protein [Cronobacter dublinensis]|uniref:hypothetical protein n=1 Tax=Cronobacter dublinensis TaxID=413497 RepID=UPI00138ACCDA|nr:hypothetical protein [Cronobacter dublinensis]MDI7274035.1 hypothetical protein [Cronobacter dublinensis]